MLQNKKIPVIENGLYLFIFVIAIFSPLFRHFDGGGDMRFFVRDWLRIAPFLGVFLINNFVLAPKFLLKSKFSTYFILVCILILSVALIDTFPFWENRPPMPRREGHFPPPNIKPIFNFGVLIISLLIIGFNSGVKIIIRWMRDENERKEKEHQYLNAELAYLKHQLSPHFFMNTLNNIHALVDIDSEGAKDAIIKLSRLMRYLLYETNSEKVLLKKEIEFVESYIELMRLRYDESRLSINIAYPQHILSAYVSSLLFLPLIENTFKHGVHSRKDCFIDILFETSGDMLSLSLKNTNFQSTNKGIDEASGIGLDNIQKRLELIYHNRYELIIKKNDSVFETKLVIPIEYA